MNKRLKSSLLLKDVFWRVPTILVMIFTLFSFIVKGQQIANYVNNGGFENIIGSTNPPKPKYWSAFDTITPKFFGLIFTLNIPPFNAPLNTYTYQWPRHGNNLLGTTFYCPTCAPSLRVYPRNRLKHNLETGETYCFTMYLNLIDHSSYAIDKIGVYFSDYSNDTIKYCITPITYLNPHLETQAGIFISDTLNWTEFHGLYTANGSENYIVIGNFHDNPNTDTISANQNYLPEIFASYCLDDISLININLPAFAGRDTIVYPGSSVYLGRESDIGIDEACIWYKLPDLINPIDTIAGFWVSPSNTSTYVVKQQLTCNSGPKWDTVIVQTSIYVGNNDLMLLNDQLHLFPNPANNYLEFNAPTNLLANISEIVIYNHLGQLIREEEFKTKINIENLPDGVYFMSLSTKSGNEINKRFVVRH